MAVNARDALRSSVIMGRTASPAKSRKPAAKKPQTMDDLANARTDAILNPQMDIARRESASRIASIQAAARAAAQILQGHVGVTQGAYDLAGKEVAGIGAGYSDAMKARIKGAQDAAAAYAASQGTPAAPGATVDATALGDTVYHGGVGIPGSSLASQGASATALANTEASIPALQGAQDVAAAAQQGEQALLDLAAKRPELHQQIVDQLYKQEMDRLAYNLNVKQVGIQQQAQDLYASRFGETVRHDVAGEKLSKERNKLSRMRYELQAQTHQDALDKAAADGRLPNASLSKAYGYIVDKSGNPILDKNGKNIPVTQSTSAKSKKEKSSAQYGKAVGEAAKMFKDSQPTTTTQYNITTTVPPKREWKWGAAMRYLQNRYGLSKSNARRALVAAGFPPPRKPTNPYQNTG